VAETVLTKAKDIVARCERDRDVAHLVSHSVFAAPRTPGGRVIRTLADQGRHRRDLRSGQRYGDVPGEFQALAERDNLTETIDFPCALENPNRLGYSEVRLTSVTFRGVRFRIYPEDHEPRRWQRRSISTFLLMRGGECTRDKS
jgi:hypothetical protein